MSNVVSKNDIPSTENMREPFLESLKSGRAKQFDSVAKDVAAKLGVTPEQSRFCMPGSSTALFQNRLKDVRASLVREGLVEIPKNGKVRLTEKGKQALKGRKKAKPSIEVFSRKRPDDAAQDSPANGTGSTAKVNETSRDAEDDRDNRVIVANDTNHATETEELGVSDRADKTNEKVRAVDESKTVGEFVSFQVSGSPKSNAGDRSDVGRLPKSPDTGMAITSDSTSDSNESDETTEVFDRPYSNVMPDVSGITVTPPPSRLTRLPREGKTDKKSPKLTKAVATVIGFAMAFGLGNFTGTNGIEKRISDEATAMAKEQVAQIETQKIESSELSFTVEAGDDCEDVTLVAVHVTGENDSGEKVDDLYKATPGVPYVVEYGAGDYLFEIESINAPGDEVVYTALPMKTAYAGDRSLSVGLDFEVDEEATKAKQEAKEKEEAEAKAKAEAEAKAKEEAEAKAKAEAEAKEKAEAEKKRKEEEAAAAAAAAASTVTKNAGATAGQGESRTVYITETGTKYHNDGCRYLKDSKIPISLEDAEARGYDPCKVCF